MSNRLKNIFLLSGLFVVSNALAANEAACLKCQQIKDQTKFLQCVEQCLKEPTTTTKTNNKSKGNVMFDYSYNQTNDGLVVVATPEYGVAYKAGLRPDDIITHLEGQKITSQKDWDKVASSIYPGQTVTLQLLRNGSKKSIQIAPRYKTDEDIAKAKLKANGWRFSPDLDKPVSFKPSTEKVHFHGQNQNMIVSLVGKEGHKAILISGLNTVRSGTPNWNLNNVNCSIRIDNLAPLHINALYASGGALIINPPKSLLDKLANGKKMKVELDFQQHGKYVANWDLSGFASALLISMGYKATKSAPAQANKTSDVKQSEAYKKALKHPKIPESAFSPMKKESYSKTYERWGATWFNKLNHMLPQAALIAADSSRCNKVGYVGLSDQRSTPKQNAVFFVDCENGERFYVSQKDIENNRAVASVKESTSKYSDGDYIEACGNAAKRRATHPSTFSFSRVWDAAVHRTDNGRVVARVGCEAKNSFGLKIEMTATCYFDETGLTGVELREK